MRRSYVILGTLVLLAPILVSAGLLPDPASPAATEQPSDLAKSLVGTWALVGEPGAVGEPATKGGRLKFITGKHWTMTESRPDTGAVTYHHGGTYELAGDEYPETVRYANESTEALIGQTFKFKLKLEGDTLTQIGLGNPYNEVWKRAK